MKTVPSTCWECSTLCGALLTVGDDGRVVHVAPNPAHPASRGAFCVKGIRGLPELTYGAGRILAPLRRTGARGEGGWREISWDEALDEMADRPRRSPRPRRTAGDRRRDERRILLPQRRVRPALALARLAELDDQPGPLRRLPRRERHGHRAGDDRRRRRLACKHAPPRRREPERGEPDPVAADQAGESARGTDDRPRSAAHERRGPGGSLAAAASGHRRGDRSRDAARARARRPLRSRLRGALVPRLRRPDAACLGTGRPSARAQ